jgi:hypothetical protein
MKPALLEGYNITAEGTHKLFNLPGSFDTINPEAVAWADKNAAKLVTRVSEGTQRMIQIYVRNSVDVGMGHIQIAKYLRTMRDTLGLNERQGTALLNYEQKLIKQGYSAAKVHTLTQTYANTLFNDRVKTIARTESAFANSEGYLGTLEQQKYYEEVEHVVSDGACEICAPMAGNRYPLKSAHGHIPVHPNCRCGWTVVIPKHPKTKIQPAGEDKLSSISPSRNISAASLQKELKRNLRVFDKFSTTESAQATKAKIADNLAFMLHDNPDFLKYAADPRWGGWGTNLDGLKKCAKDLISQWAGTSGDSNIKSVALQLAAKKEFGLTNVVANHFDTYALRQGEKLFNTYEKGLRAFVRAQYNATQTFLKANNIEYITAYRGMKFDHSNFPKSFKWGDFDEVEVFRGKAQLQPMSSFSYDSSVAQGFAYDERIIILEARVPANRILSTAQTGFGCKDEAELVVLGGEDTFGIITGNSLSVPLRDDQVVQHFIKLSSE